MKTLMVRKKKRNLWYREQSENVPKKSREITSCDRSIFRRKNDDDDDHFVRNDRSVRLETAICTTRGLGPGSSVLRNRSSRDFRPSEIAEITKISQQTSKKDER